MLLCHPGADLTAQAAAHIGQLSVWIKTYFFKQNFQETSKSRITLTQYEVIWLGYQVTGYHSCAHSLKPVRHSTAAADTARPQGILHLMGKIQFCENTDIYKELPPPHLQQLYEIQVQKRVEYPFCFTIAVNCFDTAQLGKMSSNAQTSPCTLVLFYPFLWQTFQDERPLLASLRPPVWQWWHSIIITTKHKLKTQTEAQGKGHSDFSNAD